eukprot:TRINITY_DN20822_c0_g1_i1.p1 TRINITY_DN20822_c0_g1~~TRINITY_DN20822_c0_g1_i1.p1  ORF type:complete len:104 (+),score=29.68 TRINITY_DN20822_c0_g1_i1:34-345(+)
MSLQKCISIFGREASFFMHARTSTTFSSLSTESHVTLKNPNTKAAQQKNVEVRREDDPLEAALMRMWIWASQEEDPNSRSTTTPLSSPIWGKISTVRIMPANP